MTMFVQHATKKLVRKVAACGRL